MSFNIVDASKGLLTAEVISNLAATLGESEGEINKALHGAIPAVFTSLSKQVGITNSNALSNIVEAAGKSGIAKNLASIPTAESAADVETGIGTTIMDWMKQIFGSRLNNIINSLSGFSGLNTSSSTSVLGVGVSAVLSALYAHKSSNKLAGVALSNFLGEQAENITQAIPDGLHLQSALGLSSEAKAEHSTSATHTQAASSHHSEAHNHEEDEIDHTGGTNWMWPLLLLIALGSLIFLMSRKGCHANDGATNHGAHKGTNEHAVAGDGHATDAANTGMEKRGSVDTLSGDFIYETGEEMDINLPNNAGTIRVGKWSTEAQLYAFLSDSTATVDTVAGNWFEFTNVRFKTGSADILPESDQQLKNMVAIAKAFPQAQFKIGGYTDNTGGAAINKKVSGERAKAVETGLKKMGAAAASIISSEGYGQEHPIASNDTPEGRAQNRRVAVRVKAK